MAIIVTKSVGQLEAPFILTPERYNPNRKLSITGGIRICDIAYLGDAQYLERAQERVLQIDTCDAREGVLTIPSEVSEIKSNKKRIQRGDVLISRLRPYLRQVAFVDSDSEKLACSTEFYVLRSKDGKSIAFLVPFLLSEQVQSVFLNSVEGSQHPRFKESDLLGLEIPDAIMKKRDAASLSVEAAIQKYRQFQEELQSEIRSVEAALQSSKNMPGA
ncbi:MAG: hypothetical protein SPL80_07185 [Bacilli bacterium]|nr:hypothetical protein [Bacilli bacterium]